MARRPVWRRRPNAFGPADGGRRLSWPERIAFGAGDFAHNIVFHSILTYLTYFYTDVAGVPAAAVGMIYLATRIWDGVNDPVMGYIADHTHSRWGRFRPWLLFGAVPVAVLLVAAFTDPGFTGAGKVAWAGATYLLLGMAYTMVNIPYSSLTAVMTRDPDERTVLTSTRMFLAGAGMMGVIVATRPLVGLFPSERLGFPIVMAGYGVIIVALNWWTFAAVRERVTKPPQVYSLGASFRMIAGNRPLLILGVAGFAGLSALTVRNASILYYVTYYLGMDELVPLYLAATAIPAVAAYLFSPGLAERFGKKATFIGANLGGFVAGLVLFLLPADRVGAVFGVSAAFNVVGAVVGVMTWSMLPDTVEYNQWLTGLRADGAVYSVFSLTQKLAMAAGGGIIGGVLALSGYLPGDQQGEAAILGIRALFGLIPALFSLLAAGAVAWYPITRAYYRQILEGIGAQRDRS